mmetsp:Transcript_2704/g.7921  ORF Transcript_2704/g.7921 Transcript_2704/m.7921 type:complete len:82 (+) Transcript_2704:106-351(+)
MAKHGNLSYFDMGGALVDRGTLGAGLLNIPTGSAFDIAADGTMVCAKSPTHIFVANLDPERARNPEGSDKRPSPPSRAVRR